MKGQVSVETIIAFAILLILLVIVIVHNLNVSNSAKLLEQKYKQENECTTLAYIISETYSQGKNSEIAFELSQDANIFAEQRVLKIGEQYCGFLANAEDANLSAGNIKIMNREGTIQFAQE